MANLLTLCVPGRTQSGSPLIGLDAECARREDDRSVHEAHTLETLGLLTGGVAHDFGNLLSALLGNAQLAQRLLENPNAEQLAMINDALRVIEQTVGTGKSLVQHLFAITGRGDHTRQPVALAMLCQQLRSLLRASYAQTIQFVEEFAPEVPAVIGDRVQLTQLVLNVLTNAAEAIGGRVGTIRIATAVGGSVADSWAGIMNQPLHKERGRSWNAFAVGTTRRDAMARRGWAGNAGDALRAVAASLPAQRVLSRTTASRMT